MLFIAGQTHQQIAAADQSCAESGFAGATAFGGFDKHARIARVHWQAQHLAAGVGEFAAILRNCAEHNQKLLGAFDGGRVRLVEPIESGGALDAEGVEQEHDFGEIGALDLRRVAGRPIQMRALGPQAVAGSWSGSAGAAFALVGGRAADRLDEQCPEPAFGIVAGNAGEAGVNNVANAVNRHRGFCDVGGDDDFAKIAFLERAILIFGRKIAVKGNEVQAFRSADGSARGDGGIDFAHPGHEDKDVSFFAGVDDALDSVRSLIGRGLAIVEFEVAHFHRVALAFGDKNRATVEIPGDRLGFERRGHDDELQVRARAGLDVFDEGEGDVTEEISLVKLIEENDAHLTEFGVVLEPAEENAFGDKADAGAEAGAVFETDLVADFAADGAVAFPRNAGGDGAGRNAARLENDNLFIPCQSGVQNHLWDLRGFPGAGGRDEDEAVPSAQSADRFVMDFPNGQGFFQSA